MSEGDYELNPIDASSRIDLLDVSIVACTCINYCLWLGVGLHMTITAHQYQTRALWSTYLAC